MATIYEPSWGLVWETQLHCTSSNRCIAVDFFLFVLWPCLCRGSPPGLSSKCSPYMLYMLEKVYWMAEECYRVQVTLPATRHMALGMWRQGLMMTIFAMAPTWSDILMRNWAWMQDIFLECRGRRLFKRPVRGKLLCLSPFWESKAGGAQLNVAWPADACPVFGASLHGLCPYQDWICCYARQVAENECRVAVLITFPLNMSCRNFVRSCKLRVFAFVPFL